MRCSRCNFYYCFICGMSLSNILHKASAELVCKFVGGAFFTNPWVAPILFLLIIILLPEVLIVFLYGACFFLTFKLFDCLVLKSCRRTNRSRSYRRGCLACFCSCFGCCMVTSLKCSFIVLSFIIIVIGFGLALGSIAYPFAVVFCYIFFIFSSLKVFFRFNRCYVKSWTIYHI